ncbi:TRAP transporter small permease [Enterovibrio makurazakiensis]|uniref:TRAP transporter small permease protein n=1 Tax=Enterovibrio gelatinilyticus TaxID=2899819 RepID=A0ABT5R1Z5_9GAMM|nr:TRAP transporter small permease [Enterovibrio sp. ZSDZ42]MDD1794301.1 TRAP transporter small permease [Enterovibrio sp. ZSDZ42]
MIRLLHRFEEAGIGLLLVTMTLLVFFEVILRFFFNEGLLWAQELTLYLSAWLVLMGASWGLREGAHIGVDAAVKHLPPSSQKVVTLLALALCLVYCGLFLYGSWVYLSKMKMIGIEMEDMPIEKWKAMSCLILGFGLLALRVCTIAYEVWTGNRQGFGLIDEAQESMHLAEELANEMDDKKERGQ